MIFVSTLFMIGMIACGGDDVDCTGANFSNELNAEINAIGNATTAFSLDPSSDNCNALKDAYNSYLDALEPYGDCGLTGQDKADFDQSLAEAQTAIDSLIC